MTAPLWTDLAYHRSGSSPLVILESPFRGETEGDQRRNNRYLKLALRDSISRGECPFASHAIYPLALNEQCERDLGITLGLRLGLEADFVAVYADYGITPGMEHAIDFYLSQGLTIQARQLFCDMNRKAL